MRAGPTTSPPLTNADPTTVFIGTWDVVHAFPNEGITRDYVETQVGQSIDMPTLPSCQNIVVFMNGTEAIRAVSI